MSSHLVTHFNTVVPFINCHAVDVCEVEIIGVGDN
jgi:hypothetical protein